MKAVLAATATLVSLAYFAGQLSRRSSNQQPIVVKAPDVHIDTATQAAQSQGRLERHRLLVDPYILLVVTLISVLLSGTFAGLTWIVNRNQADMMSRQLEVQAANALPIFRLQAQFFGDRSGDPYKDPHLEIVIENIGGMARYQDITIYSIGEIFVPSGPISSEVRKDAALLGFFDNIQIVDRSTLAQQDWYWTNEGSADYLQAFEDEAANLVLNEYGTTGFQINPVHTVEIEYMDYQGEQRTEYYRLVFDDSGGLFRIFDRGILQPLPNEIGENYVSRYQEAYEGGFLIWTVSGEMMDPRDVEEFVSWLAVELQQGQATPVSP